jgi:hypothetical protein
VIYLSIHSPSPRPSPTCCKRHAAKRNDAQIVINPIITKGDAGGREQQENGRNPLATACGGASRY